MKTKNLTSMKKLLLAVTAIAVTAGTAVAEGYQVNTFSARQEGMGHVGVALKLGAESNIFNPGALAFSDKTVDVTAGMSAIKSSVTANHNGTEYKTSNKVSTPFNISAAFRIYDNLYAGVSMYTPYGSSINWGDNWAGAVLNQSVDLKIFTIQPTVSWRLLPKLSIGAGLMVSWGSVDLHKALVSSSSLDRLLGALGSDVRFGSISPASVELTGSSDLSVGYNIGAMYEVTPRITIGASFRSKMQMKVSKGDAEVFYANQAAQKILGNTLDNLNQTNFSAAMPCPYVLTFGVAYRPIDRLTLAFDAQLTGWKTYDYLDFSFDHLPDFDQHLSKKYHNSWTYHLGAEYALTDRLDLRAGLMVDQSPVNKDHYNPETPGMTKIEPSLGLSFRPVKSFSIDVAFMYVKGCGADNATGQYDDFIAKNYPQLGLPSTGQFTADYHIHAVIPAIGVRYAF